MADLLPDDAQLVRSVLTGDRQSFARIVERYQNLVGAITFSGTGNLAVSEELAQETFLAAWQNLARLRDPDRLRAWLSEIARKIVASARRALGRRPVSVPLSGAELEAGTADPAEQAIRREEEALVWDTLLQLPDNYREPLILFYREQRNVRRVAEDLGLTEEAVRQRLSRGRQLLSERLADVLERTLQETRPTGVFVAGVMAALPALTPQAISLGALAAGGKGSVMSKAALLGGLWGTLLGPIIGLLGGVIGTYVGIRSAKSPKERRLMVLVSVLVFGYIASLNLLLAVAYLLSNTVSMTTTWIVLSILAVVYLGGFVALALWAAGRQRQIRIETQTDERPEKELSRVSSRRNVASSLGGGTVGSIAWIVIMAIGSADWATASVVAATAWTILVVSLVLVFRHPAAYWRVAMGMTLALAALNLAVVNLRWPVWIEALGIQGMSRTELTFPLGAMNLILIGIFTMVLVSLIYKAYQLRQTRR